MDFKKIVLAVTLMAASLPLMASASSGGAPLPQEHWSFKGIFGKFDQAAVKRGAQVAVGVCMACHSFKYIKFDQLRQFGFTEIEIKALAESQGRSKLDAMNSMMTPESGKGAFGIEPPDLSLMTKARKGYEDYTFAILNGYLSSSESEMVERVMEDDTLSETEVMEVASAFHLDTRHPEKIKVILKRIGDGENFSKYFPGNFFAMPKPLFDGQVEYTDGTENSLRQMSQDVVTFMAWAAEPTLMERKALGLKVILYLIILTLMLYALKRRIWAKVH